MRYVSLKEVLLAHTVSIKRYGGSEGVRDQGLIESALARPQARFGDYEAFPDVFAKAAALLEGLVKNHGFVDGNKRTGIIVTAVFLQKNGFEFKSGHDALLEFTVAVAEGKYDLEAASLWLKKNTKKVS
ncbi:MAG TPA: type II toxin-antitoxin system death-on-curing family toxin [Candidatus Saccharimonadales bacterium]|nr:type II toxin-antitoxin system death-on-curing family toxin [Candidatus Saccharimonadales bacterium]